MDNGILFYISVRDINSQLYLGSVDGNALEDHQLCFVGAWIPAELLNASDIYLSKSFISVERSLMPMVLLFLQDFNILITISSIWKVGPNKLFTDHQFIQSNLFLFLYFGVRLSTVSLNLVNGLYATV